MPAATAKIGCVSPLQQELLSVEPHLHEVVMRDYRLVWRFLRHLGIPEHQGDDAAQTVFARVLARHADVRAGVERAYLMKAALHISFEVQRANRRSASRCSALDADAIAGTAPTPDEAMVRRQERALLDAALDELPIDLRAAFT